MKHDGSGLIIGYLKNDLNNEELERFYQWLQLRPQNKTVFFETKLIYDACIAAGSDVHRDVDAGWQRLLEKKKNQQKPVDTSIALLNHLKRFPFSHAAAVLIGVLVSLVLSFLISEKFTPFDIEYSESIGNNANEILLPDGTIIQIATGTKLAISSDFGKKNRVVNLDGEAYFEVAKQENKPFIVKLEGQQVEVLGTKFNIKAYTNDSIATTTLLEGKIRMFTGKQKIRSELLPEQELVYNKKSRTAKINNVNASLSIVWLNGYYRFFEQPLEAILARVSILHNMQIVIASEKLKHRKFSGTFYDNQSIFEIMEIINTSIPIHWKISKNTIIIDFIDD
ncbi:MAG: FecR family protein [Dysgonamonadaceae bacterium]|jgi:ferric-dicitrate binding protein FerR (iron transport regulator)|nr:FecR family protein [Dysgonamonadaceae bacterium]